MNAATLEARALAKAKALHTHVMKVAGREGVYTVTSESEPGVKHYLVSKNGVDGCDCRGFQFRQSCRHIEALRARLAREAVAAERQQRASVADLYSDAA